MTKSIAIIAGEPNSISSEIIFKTWKFRKKYIHKVVHVGLPQSIEFTDYLKEEEITNRAIRRIYKP